jgi:ATP/maltotriose-dependent transcriptional regulator MalT/DNA-binding SARP family transcriptional activator
VSHVPGDRRLSEIQHAYPLILNKVASPHYATPLLRRARLVEWMNEAADCRAVVVAADAGYGKTTLLWQWEREARFPCYWYKLDRNDRDWTFHISYLIEAIAKRHEGFGRRAHSMLQQMGGPGSSRPGVAAYLLAEMHQRLTEPCTFIIDDWQYVNAVTEVRGLWNQILRDAPPTCRFVFASRVKPRLQFARFKTHGGYAELKTNALRFTESEIGELFRDVYNDPLDPSELSELEQRTEGWAASLQLVEVSLRERTSPDERRDFIRSITATTDSALFEFLAEEVLDQQPEETRNFLLTTSILQQITPEVAERLAGVHDGRRELTDLEHRGLFTHRLDEERYRYHHLFREFLERRLINERSESEVIGLHIHAASYFETTEQWPEAIHHYLRAGLQRQAARLIAKHGEDVVAHGGLGRVDEWLQQLPAELIRQNARLSLLYGEACGFHGEWDRAVEALSRARDYFTRKGDRRMQALACLKLSTVLTHSGDVERGSDVADEGIALVPEDAVATRLRLEGNVVVTRTWQTESADTVVAECERIAVEAAARDLEHIAAIAHHNAGEVQLRMGSVEEAIGSLARAADYWSDAPTSPFADNAELVKALLMGGHHAKARAVATEAVRRTLPWTRSNADAAGGLAAVLMADGKFREASTVLGRALRDRAALGSVESVLVTQRIDALYLDEAPPEKLVRASQQVATGKRDSRYRAEITVANALSAHAAGTCGGKCREAISELAFEERRGARLTYHTGMLKIGLLAFDHGRPNGIDRAWHTVQACLELGVGAGLRWWLRRYATFASTALRVGGGAEALCRLGALDPQGWRDALVQTLQVAHGRDREQLLESLSRLANKSTLDSLKKVDGQDVADLRRRLRTSQASRLFLRTFGRMSLHRGDWNGRPINVDKKRVRMLLALLAARAHRDLSRDLCVEILWPSADADAAVNNLNQTVFQLRRFIDPDYHGGDSPEYVTSTSEQISLNPQLIQTDLAELRRLPLRLAEADWSQRQHVARRSIALIRGEFLADLVYEEWSSTHQVRVHNEVRELLLPIAMAMPGEFAPEVSIQAASALLMLDPWDERAVVAMADGLSRSGRRVAARNFITDFANKYERELDEDPSEEFRHAVTALAARWSNLD